MTREFDSVFAEIARQALRSCDGDYVKARRQLIEYRNGSPFSYSIGNAALKALEDMREEE